MPLAFLWVWNNRQSFKLLVGLFFCLSKISESFLSLTFWHKTCTRRMLAHFFINCSLLCSIFSLILIFVYVTWHFSVVSVLTSNRDIFIILGCGRLHFENGLVHVIFDKVLLVTSFELVDLVRLGNCFLCWTDNSLTTWLQDLTARILCCPVISHRACSGHSRGRRHRSLPLGRGFSGRLRHAHLVGIVLDHDGRFWLDIVDALRWHLLLRHSVCSWSSFRWHGSHWRLALLFNNVHLNLLIITRSLIALCCCRSSIGPLLLHAHLHGFCLCHFAFGLSSIGTYRIFHRASTLCAISWPQLRLNGLEPSHFPSWLLLLHRFDVFFSFALNFLLATVHCLQILTVEIPRGWFACFWGQDATNRRRVVVVTSALHFVSSFCLNINYI